MEKFEFRYPAGQPAERCVMVGVVGSGDLEVTGNSGRNKVYGVRIGTGESATAALAAMQAEEKTVEEEGA